MAAQRAVVPCSPPRESPMKTLLLFGVLLSAALVTTAALADDQECLDAVSKGQRLKDTHKLVEAREQLRVCAASSCPAVVQSDCANWLAEVEKALPSVVLSAKGGAGADLVDVKVSVDGQPLVSKLDGQAVSMNAGPHTFRFEGAESASLEEQVVIKEGEKNQPVAVVLGGGGSSSPWKTVGWVLGGAGVVGLGVATAFGITAMGDKSDHCVGSVCDPGSTSAIKSAALASDIGWIAGGVLVASGVALVLLSPSGGREAGAEVRVAPVVAASGGGVVVGGVW